MARLVVRVQPGARSTRFAGWFGDLPKLSVAAPPVDGAANEAAIVGLAKALGLRPRHIRLVGGGASRTKRFEIDGFDAAELAAAVLAVNPRIE